MMKNENVMVSEVSFRKLFIVFPFKKDSLEL